MSDDGYPRSLEAERALLGGLLQEPERLDDCRDIEPEDFYRPDHGLVFRLLRWMRSRGEAVDLVTVPYRIARDDDPDRFGGSTYVLTLPDFCPSPAAVPTYARIVKGEARLRRLLSLAESVIEKARHSTADEVDALVSQAMEELEALRPAGEAGNVIAMEGR